MLNIPTTDRDNAIIQNINDAVLWYRIADGLWNAINAARTGEDLEFEPDRCYHGLEVTFHLLGVKADVNICETIDQIFWKRKDDKMSSMETAKLIYTEILAYLKEYSLSHLKPVA